MRIAVGLCVVASLTSGAAARQNKPDFSGHWVLVNPTEVAADAAQELVINQGPETTFPSLSVERRSKRGVDSNRYRFGVAVNMDRDSSRTRFSAKWNGNSLLVESGSYAGPAGSSAHHTGGGELWSLDAQGSLVITATERASGAEPRTTTLTYRRR